MKNRRQRHKPTPAGVPSRPAAVPPDAKLQHNPSTGAYRWLAPDGKAYDAQGAPM